MDNVNEGASMLTLAVNIIGPNDATKQVIKDGGFDTTTTPNNGVAFAYNKADYQTLDDLSDEAGEDLATFTLGIINTEDNEFYDRPELTDILAKENGLKANDLDMTLLPDLSEFIETNMPDINKAIDDVIDKHYEYLKDTIEDEPASEAPADSAGSDEGTADSGSEMVYDPSTNMFSDGDSGASAASTVPSFDANQATTPEPTSEPEQDEPTTEEMPTRAEVREAENALDGAPVNGPKYVPNPDPDLKLAARLFTDADRTELPIFDEYTMKELKGHYIKAETQADRNSSDAIMKIMARFQERRPGLEAAFEDSFKKNAAKHDATVQTITENEHTEIERFKADQDKKYEDARNAFVASQKTALEEAYDAKNRDNFNKMVTAEVNKIKARSLAMLDEENSNFKKFKTEKKNEYIERELKKTDIDDIISDFDEQTADLVKGLGDAATEFKNQLAAMTGKLRGEVENAKNEAQTNKTKFEELKANYDNKMSLEISAAVMRQTEVLNTKLDAAKKETKSAEDRSDEYQREIKSLQDKNRELDSISAQLKGQLADVQAAVTAQSNKPAPAPQVIIQKPEAEAPKPTQAPTPAPAKKSNVGGIVAGTVVGMLAALGLGIGGTAMVMNHNATNNAPRVAQSASVSSTSTASSASSSIEDKPASYKAGDTFTYHNQGDNKDYTVTMDNANTGHYTDSNGQQHTITLKNNH